LKYHDAVREAKRSIVFSAMQKASGNHADAAEAVGAPREQPAPAHARIGAEVDPCRRWLLVGGQRHPEPALMTLRADAE